MKARPAARLIQKVGRARPIASPRTTEKRWTSRVAAAMPASVRRAEKRVAKASAASCDLSPISATAIRKVLCQKASIEVQRSEARRRRIGVRWGAHSDPPHAAPRLGGPEVWPSGCAHPPAWPRPKPSLLTNLPLRRGRLLPNGGGPYRTGRRETQRTCRGREVGRPEGGPSAESEKEYDRPGPGG